MFTSKNIQNNHNIKRCNTCDFECSKSGDWNRHILTSKHLKMTEGYKNDINLHQITSNIGPFICSNCNNSYKYNSGLWRHNKICCKKTKIEEVEPENNEKNEKNENNDEDMNNSLIILELLKQNQDFKEMILEKSSENNNPLVAELLKQNQEFKEMMMEQNKHMLELAKNAGHNNSNNTTNNTKFNLQFFLNDTCKDAMNITDFVNSLVLDFEDLENMGHLGYVEGISRIFLRGVRGMDVTNRPFHCSDIKRETMFVKELEGWEKENSDNEKMTMTIKRIACKNLRQATAWMAAHQKAIADTDSKPHSQYMKMMSQCLGGSTAAEDKSNYNKIIKRVAQEVFIDKNKD